MEPDSYQVTWWPKDAAHGEINSQQTKDDHLLITGLKPCTTYNVVVESRKLQSYADIQGKYQVLFGNIKLSFPHPEMTFLLLLRIQDFGGELWLGEICQHRAAYSHNIEGAEFVRLCTHIASSDARI